jgi:flagellin-like protein
MLKRKALSPLIATILLVAVSLSLAGILYSWSSQNVGDTTRGATEFTEDTGYCTNVSVSIDEKNCSYDSNSGFTSLLIQDASKVNIEDNLVLTVIDANNEIASVEISPNFTGNLMSLGSFLSGNEDFIGLETPLKRVQIYVKKCPNQVHLVTRCN